MADLKICLLHFSSEYDFYLLSKQDFKKVLCFLLFKNDEENPKKFFDRFYILDPG